MIPLRVSLVGARGRLEPLNPMMSELEFTWSLNHRSIAQCLLPQSHPASYNAWLACKFNGSTVWHGL